MSEAVSETVRVERHGEPGRAFRLGDRVRWLEGGVESAELLSLLRRNGVTWATIESGAHVYTVDARRLSEVPRG